MDKNGAVPLETISWIHLSDLHLTQEYLTNEKDQILDAFFQDIESRKDIDPRLENVDLLFITGDITQAGKDFDLFYEKVLLKLLEKSSLGIDKCFIVPGNHDCIRNKIQISRDNKGKLNELIPRKIKDVEMVSQIFNNSDTMNLYLERLENYFIFFKEKFSHIKLIDSHYYKYQVKIKDTDFIIFGFNSCWCAGQYIKPGNNEDCNKMILGRAQVSSLVTGVNRKNTVIISLMHHDEQSFKSFEIDSSITPVKHNSDFLLHGHTHKPKSNYSKRYENEVISAGSIDHNINEEEDKTIGYNYVIIDPNTKDLEVIHRIFDIDRMSFDFRKKRIKRPLNDNLSSKLCKSEMSISQSVQAEISKDSLKNKAIIEELESLKRDKFNLYLDKIEFHDKANDYKELINDYTELINLVPEEYGFYNNRGVAKADLGRHQDAIEDYNKAIEIDPKIEDAYNNRGNAKADLGRHEEALKDYNKAIEIDPKYAKAYYNRGNAKGKLDRHQEAIEDYDKAIEIDPKYAMAYNNRGNAKAKLIQFEEAIVDYNKAIEIDPKDAMAYNNRGVAKNDLDRHQEAIEDYNKAIELDPKDAYVYYNRGKAKDELGRHQKAIDDYNKAIEINPKYINAYILRGVFYYYQGEYYKSKDDFDEVARLDPSNSGNFSNRGRINLVLGDIKEGFDDCNMAIELNGKESVAYLNRSIAYLLMDNKVESKKDYEKVKKLANEQNDEHALREIAKCFDEDGNLLPDWNVPKRD